MADRSGEKEATAPSVDIERQREMNGHWSRTRTCVQIFMMTSVGTNLSHFSTLLISRFSRSNPGRGKLSG